MPGPTGRDPRNVNASVIFPAHSRDYALLRGARLPFWGILPSDFQAAFGRPLFLRPTTRYKAAVEGGTVTRSIFAAIILAAIAAASPAWAQKSGWYLGGEGGWTALGNQEGHLPPRVFPQTFDNGYALGVRAGYRFGPWRVEEEFRHQSNSLNHFARHPAEGERGADMLMTNAIYDLDIGLPVSPHLGAGIGLVALHDEAQVAVLGIPSVDDDTEWAFGYQAIAGLSYAIAPEVSADLDYRYMATTTPHFTTAPGLIVDGVFTGDKRFASAYGIQQVLLSLTWHFGG